jgi:hypothetical protein
MLYSLVYKAGSFINCCSLLNSSGGTEEGNKKSQGIEFCYVHMWIFVNVKKYICTVISVQQGNCILNCDATCLVEKCQEPAASIFHFTQKMVPPKCSYLSPPQRHIPEESSLHIHCQENFKSCVAFLMVWNCALSVCCKLNSA